MLVGSIITVSDVLRSTDVKDRVVIALRPLATSTRGSIIHNQVLNSILFKIGGHHTVGGLGVGGRWGDEDDEGRAGCR